ncbi:hypothetical protein G6F56_008095 [Rhizopus delemar]|nr:hypothetical protein G6F56_008095 [Rhizopus delemar]
MQPHTLNSNTVNPANLLEIQVLSKIVTELRTKKDISGTIPYLAKIVQIVDNQKIEKDHNYHRQMKEYRQVQSRAHFDLGQAYFETHQYTSSETYLSMAAKTWENLLKYENMLELKDCLHVVYDYLKTCYESMGKNQLAQHMESRKTKLR